MSARPLDFLIKFHCFNRVIFEESFDAMVHSKAIKSLTDEKKFDESLH